MTILDESDKKGYIHKIYERKNLLIRPRVANIDCAVIIASIKSPDINLHLLDKFIVLAEYQSIPKIIICINKYDLSDSTELDKIKYIYKNTYDIFFTSTIEKTKSFDINNLKDKIKGNVTVFAGPSGVGKSSLINCIIPDANLKTGEISKKISRGKHTTRQVELLEICNDTYIIDSPGFTSLDLKQIKPENLDLYFKEFLPILNQCKFKNCNHIFEPECAIKNEVGKTINEKRYMRYISIFNELPERNYK